MPVCLRLFAFLCLLAPLLLLSACGGAPQNQAEALQTRETPPPAGDRNGVMPLATAERLYRRTPDSATAAVHYAQALRQAGRLSRASIVIAPFARDDRKPSAAARTEFAAVQVALGNNDTAVDYARRSIAMNGKSWQAHYTLGMALDAKGDHPGAEPEFRRALDLYDGNPVAILNALGLNLAAQGFLDEADETLVKARDLAANPEEIDRNLRIVKALRVSGGQAPSYMTDARTAARKKAAASRPQALVQPVRNPVASASVIETGDDAGANEPEE